MRHWLVGLLLLVTSTVSISDARGLSVLRLAPTDDEITKQLVGKWAFDEVGQQGLKVKGTAHYKKDGTFEGEATIGTNEKPVKVALSGTWKVAEGVITSTVTKSSLPVVIAKGFNYKFQVIAIDDDSLKYKNEADKEVVRMRLKE